MAGVDCCGEPSAGGGENIRDSCASSLPIPTCSPMIEYKQVSSVSALKFESGQSESGLLFFYYFCFFMFITGPIAIHIPNPPPVHLFGNGSCGESKFRPRFQLEPLT